MARFNPPLPLSLSSMVRITVVVKTQGNLQLTAFDYICTNTINPSLADIQALRAAWQTASQTALLACLSPLSTIVQYITSELFYGTTPTDDLILGSPPVGTAGAFNLPLESSAVLTKLTAVKGQHGRGRLKMPAVPETFTTPATDPNVLNSTGVAAYNQLVSTVQGGLTTGFGSWTWALFQRPPKGGTTLYSRAAAVETSNTELILGSQRSRKPGKGI